MVAAVVLEGPLLLLLGFVWFLLGALLLLPVLRFARCAHVACPAVFCTRTSACMRFPLSCDGLLLLRRPGLGPCFGLGLLRSACRPGTRVWVWLVAVVLLLLGQDWWCVVVVVELR